MVKSAQTILLNCLRSIQATPAAKAFLKRTCQEFVLEHGWWYEPVQLPEHLAIGTPEQCHTNAVNFALDDDSLIYCEGYVSTQAHQKTLRKVSAETHSTTA